MSTGEERVREEVTFAGWKETEVEFVFVDPENEHLTLRVYPSFFVEGVTPAYLIVETLDGDPARAPVGLQAWVSGRIPKPRKASVILWKDGIVCRVGDLTVEG